MWLYCSTQTLMKNDLIHSEKTFDRWMDRQRSECTFALTQGKYNVTGQDFPVDCVIVFSHWRVKVEQIPRSIRRQMGSAAYFKGDKTQSYIVVQIFSFSL